MKVSFFNTYLQGGAANAAINLYHSLEGVEKQFFYKENIPARYNSIVETESSFKRVDQHLSQGLSSFSRFSKSLKARKYYKRVNQLLQDSPSGFEQFSVPNQFGKTSVDDFDRNIGIVHLHWIAEWIDYPSFFDSLPDTTPIVWTLHDMNPFTAGCHFSMGCEQYLDVCDRCPQLSDKKSVRSLFSLKQQSISRFTNLHVVSPSNWLSSVARESTLFSHADHHVIPYGIDTDIFKPCESKHPAFEDDRLKVLYVAADLHNKRKGFSYYQDLSESYEGNDDILFYSVGEDSPFASDIKQLGQIDSREELAQVYSSADVLICTSIQDNLPNVILESLSCGTPIIGFGVGGIVDLIDHRKNGFIVSEISTNGLREYLDLCFNQKEILVDMTKASLDVIKQRFSLEMQAEYYRKIYKLSQEEGPIFELSN